MFILFILWKAFSILISDVFMKFSTFVELYHCYSFSFRDSYPNPLRQFSTFFFLSTGWCLLLNIFTLQGSSIAFQTSFYFNRTFQFLGICCTTTCNCFLARKCKLTNYSIVSIPIYFLLSHVQLLTHFYNHLFFISNLVQIAINTVAITMVLISDDQVMVTTSEMSYNRLKDYPKFHLIYLISSILQVQVVTIAYIYIYIEPLEEQILGTVQPL